MLTLKTFISCDLFSFSWCYFIVYLLSTTTLISSLQIQIRSSGSRISLAQKWMKRLDHAISSQRYTHILTTTKNRSEKNLCCVWGKSRYYKDFDHAFVIYDKGGLGGIYYTMYYLILNNEHNRRSTGPNHFILLWW